MRRAVWGAVLALTVILKSVQPAQAQASCFGSSCWAQVLAGITAVTGTGTTVVLQNNPTLNSVTLPNTTFASQYGIVYKNSTPWLHDFNYGNNGTVTTDGYNVFLGGAGNLTMGSTAVSSGQSSYNIGVGSTSLLANTRGQSNVAIGYGTLASNTTGSNTVAIGVSSLAANTTGGENIGIGVSALRFNIGGSANTAVGVQSLYSNTSGNDNVGVGYFSLFSNTAGRRNVAVGDLALYNVNSVTSVGQNTAVGYFSGWGITTGVNNTVLGANVGLGAAVSNNVVIGDGDGQQRIRSFPSLALTKAGGAETVLTLTSTTTNAFTVDVDYMVKASDATPDYAVRKGSVGLVCVNNATVVTCTPSATDQTNDGRNGGGSILINTNAKTLTYAITVDVSSANVAVLKFNIDSDMTVTAAGITMTVTINGIVTPS